MASSGRGDGATGRQSWQSQAPSNYPANQGIIRGMKQLQVSGPGSMMSGDQPNPNDQAATPWTVTNVGQDKRATKHAQALMKIRNDLQNYEQGGDVDIELLNRCIALGFDEEISRETLRANRDKEFGVVLATLMSLTQISGGKSIKSLAPGSLQYSRGGSPGSGTTSRLVRNEQVSQNPKLFGHAQTPVWSQGTSIPTSGSSVFIKSAPVPPGRLDSRASFVRGQGIDSSLKVSSVMSNEPLRVDRSQFNVSERKISEASLTNYPEVRLRQNRPNNRDSQKRWSADVLQKTKAFDLPSKRNSLAFEVGDRRSPLDIPNKPPPPYPGFTQAHAQQDAKFDQWLSMAKLSSSNGNMRRIASVETIPKIGTESPRINSPVTIINDNRKQFLNGSEMQGVQQPDVSMYSNVTLSKQFALRDPPPYHSHVPLKRTYSPNERTNPAVVPRRYPASSLSQQPQPYSQSNGLSIVNVDSTFMPIRSDTLPENSFGSGQDEVALSRGSPPPYPGLESRLTAKEKRFSYASDVDSGTSSKRASAIFADGSTQSDSSGSTSPTPETIESRCSPLPMTNSPFHTLVIHSAETEPKINDVTAKYDKEPVSSRLKSCSSQAFKFYMEQHVENVLKSQQLREKRRKQLEIEMRRVGLSEESQTEMRKMLVQKESNHIRMKRSKMTRLMFSKVKTLGMGAFGEVALVRKIDSNALYAMKVLRKTDVLRRNQVAHVKAERDILAEADNEWVVKLYYSFQDNKNLYFVMEYVPGGDLMALLIKKGIFSEELSKFYTAELVLAVESVHKMGFIHRDIKPDNVLIDRNGHIKLTDFGLCTGFRWTHDSKYYQQDSSHARQPSMEPEGGWEKMLNDGPCDCGDIIHKFDLCKPLDRRAVRRHMRCLAHSLVGTPNYIAPEVLLRIPYTQLCDWWSVGVILYEMLVGQPPFLAKSPAETQMRVVHWQSTLQIPRQAKISPHAKDLISCLCSGAENRIGRQGTDEIKKHPFFSDVDWANCLKSKPPPYVPKIKHATDTSNFDSVPEKETENEGDDPYDEEKRKILEKAPQHAFYEFTFRRFFDEGGHPQALCIEEEASASSQQDQNGCNVPNNKRTATTSDTSVPVPSKVPAPPLNQQKLEDKAPVYV